MLYKLVIPILLSTVLICGCGVENGVQKTQPAVEYEPNSNQLPVSHIQAIIIREFYYGTKQPIKSLTVQSMQGTVFQTIVGDINNSKVVILPSATKLVSPPVGPKTIFYEIIVPNVDTFTVGPAWSGTYDEKSRLSLSLSPGVPVSVLAQLFHNASSHLK